MGVNARRALTLILRVRRNHRKLIVVGRTLRLGWAIPRFSVPLSASLILRAKQLRYILRADAVVAWAAWVVIFFAALVSFDPTVEYARSGIGWARGAH